MSAVYSWRKGHSTKDRLASTLAKAIYDLGRRLNCDIFITKVARCSTKGALLSKGDIRAFYDLCPESPVDPLRIPGTLLLWLNAPRVDYQLGDRIAEDLGKKGVFVLQE